MDIQRHEDTKIENRQNIVNKDLENKMKQKYTDRGQRTEKGKTKHPRKHWEKEKTYKQLDPMTNTEKERETLWQTQGMQRQMTEHREERHTRKYRKKEKTSNS